jgi:hypothetical protein
MLMPVRALRVRFSARASHAATGLLVALFLVTLLLTAAFPAGAGARVVIGDGEARLTLDRGLARQLNRAGVDVRGIGTGAVRGRTIEMPVVAGATNGAAGRGALTVEGGFSFDAGVRIARFTDLLLNTGKGQSTAGLAGKRRILAKHGQLSSSPAGFGTRIRIRQLKLTAGTAAALNRKLGERGLFHRGQRLGSFVIVAIPDTVAIAFGKIAMGGPETTFSKLESIDVQMGIWGATERWTAGIENYWLFGIAPTAVAPDASSGLLEAAPNDGVTMEIHAPPARNMLLRGPRVNLGLGDLTATVSALSTEGPETVQIGTLDYSAARFQIRPKVGVFELMGIRAVSNQFIADQLNARFQTPGFFAPGETLARITITMNTPPRPS